MFASFPAVADPGPDAPRADGAFSPLDLRGIANLDPLCKDDPFGLGPLPSPKPWLWVEAETCNKHQGDFGPESRAAASNGLVLGNGWGTNGGEWAEWYFDLPFESAMGQLYLRAARSSGNPLATLQVSLDGQDTITFSIPLTGGPGDTTEDFEVGLIRAVVRDLHMGRHVLRITIPKPGDLTSLDGFWLADGQQDFINRVDEEKHLPRPAALHMLVYPYGSISIRRIPFELLDPVSNAGKGVCLSSEGRLTIPGKGKEGNRLHLLGAGVHDQVQIQAEAAYDDGTIEQTQITLGPLFSKNPPDPAATLGSMRYGYLATLPLQRKPLRELRCRSDVGDYVVIAATLEKAP